MCGKHSPSFSCCGGNGGTGPAEGYVRSLARPSGGHCHGYHPSLGEACLLLLRELLHRYEHVFPAPGEPATGRTTSVQHELLTSDVLRKCCWGGGGGR